MRSLTRILAAVSLFVALAAPAYAVIVDPQLRGYVVAMPTGQMQGENDVISGSAGGSWAVPPAPAQTLDINNFVGANRFYAAGYDGSATVAANVEAGHIWGIAGGHETLGHVAVFQHQVPPPGPPPPPPPLQLGDVDRHATWVGMHIGGRQTVGGGAWQRGISDQATLWSGAVATSWNGPPYALSFNMVASTFRDPYVTFFQTGVGGDPTQTADVINSSWGFNGSSDVRAGMDYRQMVTDALSNANPLTTFVASVGNDGDGPNTVRGFGAAYNVIAVGALASDTMVPPYDAVANFSSRGPSDYGDPNGIVPNVRATVDIVAPGTNLTAAYYGGLTGGNSFLIGAAAGPGGGPSWYTGQLAGTSFASPITAGGAALVDDAGYGVFPANPNARDARVVKAVLLNAADKIPGWNNGQSGTPIITTQSLDYNSGAGRLNLDRTFDQYASLAAGGRAGTTDVPGLGGGNVAPIGWDYGSVIAGAPNDYNILTALFGDSMFTVTLDWFRDRSININTGAVSDDSYDNLDLEMWSLTGNPLAGGVPAGLVATSASIFNNVEHLYFPLPQTGWYMVRVIWTGEHFDEVNDADEEIYGLAWWGSPVPEPTTVGLLAFGVLALVRRRRRRAA